MKRFKRLIAKVLIVALLCSNILTQEMLAMTATASQNIVSTVSSQVQVLTAKPEDMEKTQIIVKYKEADLENSVNLNTLVTSVQEDQAKQKDALKDEIKEDLDLTKLDTKEVYDQENVEVLEIKSSDNINEVVKALNEDPLIDYAQPNYKLSTSAVNITDDKYPNQWAIYDESTEFTVNGIHAIQAWNAQKSSDTNVLIGILDTGIDIQHKDLVNNIFVNKSEISGNGIDDDGNSYIDDVTGYDFANHDASVYDDATKDKHGTHVAGIIAADDNGTGTVGVAKDAKILPLKFINGTEGYTSDAIEAIAYAKSMGVDMINCSFGSTDNNPALEEAIKNSGILFIASVGNTGQDVTSQPVYPACFNLSNVISVTAYDASGKLGAFANFGSSVDVAAPGVGILSTIPGNLYESLSGTSMAAPFVTGIAALIKSKYADITPAEIIERIKGNTIAMDLLKGKVSTGGRVDAYEALMGTQAAAPKTTNTEVSKEKEVFTDATLTALATATVSPELMEQIHYGETGVDAATGNYSTTATDLSMESPGFTINISRTYNSKNEKSGFMGKGWTFGFEGSFKVDTTNTSLYIAKMPNGSAHTFTKNADGTFTANDFRGTLATQTDGTWILKTPDQYTYGYNTYGWLVWMKDPSGNKVSISVDNTSGKISAIVDQLGRTFSISYNSANLIEKITDPMNRVVNYYYENNLLKTVTDPTGPLQKYEYDTFDFLVKVKNHNNVALETIVYDHNVPVVGVHKVKTYTDIYGDVLTYTYETNKTTIKDSNNRTIVKKFDNQFYVIESQDPEGKSTKVEYYKDGSGVNLYGEEKNITDRNGNVTSYERNTATGNISATVYPDGSSTIYWYDDKNNTIMEQDPEGNKTFFVYDANKVKVTKEVRPINGTDAYLDSTGKCLDKLDQSKFIIKTYVYYNETESTSLGYQAKNLLKSVTDAEGNTTRYTYDTYGNTKTITDAEGYITTNTYNILGWLLATKTPSGYTTTYKYDLCGRLTKQVLNAGETTRYIYDVLGRKVQEISPNLYSASADGLNMATPTNTYSDSSVGTTFVYNDKNQVVSKKDAGGYTNSYKYEDLYGNLTQETLPNGLIYKYEYDVMNRKTKTYIKADTASDYVIQDEVKYESGTGTTIKRTKQYLSEVKFNSTLQQLTPTSASIDVAETVLTYDYANRLISQKDADGTSKYISYLKNGLMYTSTDANSAITYYRYDAQGHLTGKWVPVELGKYNYSGCKYDRAGRVVETYAGKDVVGADIVPSADRLVTTYTAYDENGQVLSKTDNDGRKTAFEYTGEGKVNKATIYITSTKTKVTKSEYNHSGNITKKTEYINAGDLSINDIGDMSQVALTESYEYDLNGNLKKKTDVNGRITNFTYDNLNRQLTTTYESQDENLAYKTVTVSNEYDFRGNVTKSVDPMGVATFNSYTAKGELGATGKLISTEAGLRDFVSAYSYDNGGRKILEISPNDTNIERTYRSLLQGETAPTDPLALLSGYGKMLGSDITNRTEYTYDKMGRQLTKKDIYLPSGDTIWQTITTSNKYDALGNVVKTIDGMGFETTYTYNLLGQLTTTTDPETKLKNLPFTTKIAYDGLGRKISETNALGMVTTSYYNDASNVVKTTVRKSSSEAEYTLSAMTYDLIGNLLTSTDANNNKTTYIYNSMNKVRAIQHPSDDTVGTYLALYQYDKSGNLMKQQDSMGQVQLFTYDLQSRLLTHTTKDLEGKNKITTSTTYDLNGNPRFIKDGNGNLVTKTYNGLNQLLKEEINTKSATGAITNHSTTYAYDKNGNNTIITDFRGNTITNVYDPLNRLIEKKDPLLNTISTMTYNNNHAQIETIDGKKHSTLFAYDKNNRLIKTIDAEGNSTQTSYDAVGNAITKTDGRDYMTKYNYDAFSRLTSVENAKGEVTTYTYDFMGNLLTQTDGNRHTTTKIYNARNLLTKTIDAKGILTALDGTVTYDPARTESITYYPIGLPKDKIDRNGKTTTNTYDIFGRVLSTKSETESISSTYDNNGNLLTMTDATGKTIRTYDELGRVLMKSVPIGGIMNFEYDIVAGIDAGKWAEKSTDSKGNVVSKIYDGLGRLEKVTADGITSTYKYDANGNKDTTTYSTGYVEKYIYNNNNQLVTLETRKTDLTVLTNYSYTYDHAGNQVSKNEASGLTTYSYDCLNRLEKVSEPGNKVTKYVYDGAGNRLKETLLVAFATTKETLYSYNEQNRLTTTLSKSAQGTIDTVKFTYDNNGNNTYESKESKTLIANVPEIDQIKPTFGLFISGQASTNPSQTAIAAFEKSYQYNNFNQMVKAVTGSNVSEYAYNGEGLRTKATVNSDTTIYVYEGDKVVLELDGNGKEKAQNIYGDSRLISRNVGANTAMYLFNGHGDVTGLLSSTGTIMATYAYDAFGNITDFVNMAPTFTNPYKYAGYQYDDATGLYYLNARMYNSVTARFMQMDTYLGNGQDPLSLNLYTYCSNEPIRYTDPTGHIQSKDVIYNSETQAQLIALTNAYYNKEATQEEKEVYRIKADALRKKENEGVSTNSDIRNAVNDAIKEIKKDGTVSQAEWKTITSANGINYYFNNTQAKSDDSSKSISKNSNTITTFNNNSAISITVSSKLTVNRKNIFINPITVDYNITKSEGFKDWINKGTGDGTLKISLDGANLLAEMEVGLSSKYMVKEDGVLKGIITHDVGDGGLTIGYGYYIEGGLNNIAEINRLKNEYGIVVKEGVMVDIDKVAKLYADSLTKYEGLAKDYVNSRGLKPSQYEFDALVIQSYNGAHYKVMDAFGNKSLNDAQALDKAIETYSAFGGWEDYKDGWTNRLRNIFNLYRHGDYTKLY